MEPKNYFKDHGITQPTEIVSFRYVNSEKFYNDQKIIIGYIDAAEIIVTSIFSKGIATSIDDHLFFPLMNLYVHAIEFSLKLIIRKIEKHRSENCFLFERLEFSAKNKVLNDHNIQALANEINNYLQGMIDTDHVPSNWIDSHTMVSEIGNYITSMSSRYFTDLQSNPYTIYERQRRVNLVDLHNDVKKLCNSSLFFLEEAICCDLNKYIKDKNMVKERAEGLQLYCKKYESIIINKKIISPILTGDKLLEAVVEGCREQSKLAAYLLNLNPEVIENILKCIYFSKSGKWNFETGLSNIQDKIIDITQYSLNYLKDVLRDNENFCNRVIVLEEIYKKLS